MSNFKVGDKVYFSPFNGLYQVKAGHIVEFRNSLPISHDHVVVQLDSDPSCRYHILPRHLYYTEEEVKEVLKREFYSRVNEVKKDIHTLEDLLKFLYNNDVTIDEDDGYCVWEERVAVRELAKEICGIELGE